VLCAESCTASQPCLEAMSAGRCKDSTENRDIQCVQGRRRRQAQQSGQDGQRQAVQETLQSLRAHRDLANDPNQRTNMSMPSLGQLVRAIGGGGDRQQSGPSIIGQLMRSPVVENLVQQVMQGVGDVDVGGGARRGPAAGGLDLSGMLQHVVPVVTQMLNGGSSAAFPGSAAGYRENLSLRNHRENP
jgi:hypothetical protein